MHKVLAETRRLNAIARAPGADGAPNGVGLGGDALEGDTQADDAPNGGFSEGDALEVDVTVADALEGDDPVANAQDGGATDGSGDRNPGEAGGESRKCVIL
ncbi:hypothetical protein Ciccas_011752 [Cichlidogyrus casuarinus]|uniref:Uncharacterized protein n=1 Tax=Cichlidogyrus casuarinus TaxID=1844966 RepID=A0ABD2PR12_9PLAT